jgi:hypothetical protein
MEERKFKLEGLEEESDDKGFETQSVKRSKKHSTKQSLKHSGKPSSLDDSVTLRVTVSPRKLLKWSVIILVLLCVFFLGRYSAGGSCDAVVASGVEVAAVSDDVAVDDGTISKVGGFFKSLFSGSTATGGATVENNTTTEVGEVESPGAEDITDEVIIEAVETVEENAEPVITTYSKVALSLGDVTIDWKSTWGKVKSFQYTIKNNEAGTIEPDHFVMLVEGYDDYEKVVPLPKSSQSLKSAVVASSYATVPSGFSYSELSTGDLSTVDVTIIMYDDSGKEMAQVKKSVDLNGE